MVEMVLDYGVGKVKVSCFLFLYLRWTDQPYQFCFVLCRVIDVRDDSDDVFV